MSCSTPFGGFEIYTAGTPTLWTARTNGTGARALVPGAARPAFSPNGRTLAFAMGDRAWVMPAAGGPAHAVSRSAPGETVHGLAFSPDGRFLVIARQRQILPLGPSQLFIVRLRDGHERNLHVGALAGSPDWQPLPLEERAVGSTVGPQARDRLRRDSGLGCPFTERAQPLAAGLAGVGSL
jgi:hypothetical protein